MYAVGHAELVREGRALAAQLACGDDAALGFGQPGIHVHRATLAPGDVVEDGPIRHTSLARTALDLAAAVPERHVRRLLREAELRRMFDLRALQDVLERNAGRAGTPVLRAVLADLDPGPVNEGLEEDVLCGAPSGWWLRPRTSPPTGSGRASSTTTSGRHGSRPVESRSCP